MPRMKSWISYGCVMKYMNLLKREDILTLLIINLIKVSISEKHQEILVLLLSIHFVEKSTLISYNWGKYTWNMLNISLWCDTLNMNLSKRCWVILKYLDVCKSKVFRMS